MLITRKSRNRRPDFDLRTRSGSSLGGFTVRQYRRCREELVGAGVHAGVLAMLGFSLLVFGHRLWRLFHQHADAIRDSWLPRLVIGAIGVSAAFVFWRLGRKIIQIKELKMEHARLRRELTQQPPTI